ncbi:MAG: lysophospholipid acyltransferase family protein [Candidatus Sumerlaeota bacterium]
MERWTYKTSKDIALGPRERTFSVARETTLISSITQFLSWTTIKTYLRVFHRLKIIGSFPPDLKPPFVVVANHSSHLDAMILAAALPVHLRDHVFLVAAGDVFFKDAKRAFLSSLLLNCLPMWRKSAGPQAMKELRARMMEPHTGLILFPEGARSRDGRMLPFKPGIGMMIAGTPATVLPCRIRGAFRACPPEKGMPRPYQIILSVGKPLSFENATHNRKGWEEVVAECESAVRGYRPEAKQ